MSAQHGTMRFIGLVLKAAVAAFARVPVDIHVLLGQLNDIAHQPALQRVGRHGLRRQPRDAVRILCFRRKRHSLDLDENRIERPRFVGCVFWSVDAQARGAAKKFKMSSLPIFLALGEKHNHIAE